MMIEGHVYLRADARHVLTLQQALNAWLPDDVSVSAFGSRATGLGLKAHSDLDLLVDSPVELPLIVLANLREALNESDLPFAVDILDRKDASDSFLEAIKTQGLITLKRL